MRRILLIFFQDCASDDMRELNREVALTDRERPLLSLWDDVSLAVGRMRRLSKEEKDVGAEFD